MIAALAARADMGFTVLGTDAGTIAGRSVMIDTVLDAPEPAWSAEELDLFGRGLSADDRAFMLASRSGTQLLFDYDAHESVDALRAAEQLTEEAAAQLGAVVSDFDTREIFTRDAWHTLRVARMTPFTAPARQVVVHYFAQGDAYRAVSLGMRRFGLPDVTVDDFPGTAAASIGSLVTLVLDTMVQSPTVAPSSTLLLPPITPSSRTFTMPVAIVEPQDGDAENRQIALQFPGDPTTPPSARILQFLTRNGVMTRDEMLGTPNGDPTVAAARDRARAQLPSVRARFARGLAPGSVLTVDAPFETSHHQSEYMWVEVHSWNGTSITGTLTNQPDDVPSLHMGDTVTVDDSLIDDYGLTFPDGGVERGGTNAVLQATGVHRPL